MAKEMTAKTNAMRRLEREKIPYTAIPYECGEFVDGVSIAEQLGEDPALVYKTLVTVGKSGEHYVFVIPVAEEIDLKRAAGAVGEKSLEMLHVKDLLSVTGYIRGGCTAIGMKKPFRTVVDSSARELPELFVSGGKRGVQLRLSPEGLLKACGGSYGDVAAR